MQIAIPFRARLREQIISRDHVVQLGIIGVSVGIILALIGIPLLMLLLSSVKSTEDILPFEGAPFTLKNYIEVFLSAETYRLLLNTLVFVVGSVGLALSLATLFAWLFERTNMPFRSFFFVLVLSPMAVPPLMKAIAWILLLSPTIGFLNILLRDLFSLNTKLGPINVYSLGGMVFVAGVAFVPSMVLMLAGMFSRMDPALEEASAASGATHLRTFCHVMLPLMRPVLAGAAIYNSIVALGIFDIPALLGLTAGIHVFSSKIYIAAHPPNGLPDYGLASTYGCLLLIMALVLISLYTRLTRHREQFAIISGKAYHPRRVDIGIWKYPALLLVSLYGILAVLMPIIILVWASLQKFYTPPSSDGLRRLTLDHYYAVLHYPLIVKALWNTLVVAVLTATVVLVLTIATSWLIARSRTAAAKALDGFIFSSVGIPGVIMGLGMLFVFAAIPAPIYGTIWLLVIALVTNYLPYSSRVLSSAMLQIHQELEDASVTCGGSWLSTLRKITCPLLLPSLLSAWLWVAVHAARELSLVLMLYSRDNIVLSTIIWTSWQEQGDMGLAAVLGVILIVLSGAVTILGRRYLVQSSNLH
ncbi:MAG TPA: iron ABC transporter permease [Candidatus Binatia bacterium]